LPKEKLESDYQNLNKQIDEEAEEAIKKIREKANEIREEAKKIGETVQNSLNKGEEDCKEKG